MYTFKDLVEITAKLRAEDGCPWDREQTFESLRKYMREEAEEAVQAVDNEDMENLCEELGDLLFLILLQSKIAEEEGIFTLDDVIDAIGKKMIRRHPHVFPDQENGGKNPGWEEIKKQEKSGKNDDFFRKQKKILLSVQKEMIHYLEEETAKHGSGGLD